MRQTFWRSPFLIRVRFAPQKMLLLINCLRLLFSLVRRYWLPMRRGLLWISTAAATSWIPR
jgi:hypothetical protein